MNILKTTCKVLNYFVYFNVNEVYAKQSKQTFVNLNRSFLDIRWELK